MPDVGDTRPMAEPEAEPSDPHTPPLDDREDGRYLRRDDPRRLEAEGERGRPFDDDDETEADDGT